MKGGLTYQDMERRKQAEKNTREALEYLRGLDLCERCMKVVEILKRGIQ